MGWYSEVTWVGIVKWHGLV